MNQYIVGIGGDEGFKVGVGRVVYKDLGIKRGGEEVSTKRVWVNISGS